MNPCLAAPPTTRSARFGVGWWFWPLALLLAALPVLGRADALDDIRQRGTLVVGVKKDVPLWGLADPRTGVPVGLEPDLAADLAKRIGVKLRLVGVLSSDRLAVVEQRQVDLLIATLSDTPQRRQRVTLVRPNYYATGANVLVRRSEGLKSWEGMRDRRVCGRRGGFSNRSITVTHGVDIVALYSNTLGLEALRDGRCDAVLHEETNIVALLQDPAWKRDYEMPLESLHIVPWAIALHQDAAGGRLDKLVSLAVAEWHRSGHLLELERRWGIPASAFVVQMNRTWTRRDRDRFYCGEPGAISPPRDCL
jgi:polar amino acid transport system substrate-binding protein